MTAQRPASGNWFNNPTIMGQWDAWRRHIADGGKASWPRDAFESLLDDHDEQITALRTRVAELEVALKAADQFIANGIELGYIRMPTPGTPDSALKTPGIIRAALERKP